MRGKPMLGVRLDPDIQARLAALAKATGRTKAYYVREAILMATGGRFTGSAAVTRARRRPTGRRNRCPACGSPAPTCD